MGQELLCSCPNFSSGLDRSRESGSKFKPLGVLASLGRRSAVAEILGFRFSGFFVWWLWRTIYLFKLPGLDRKLRVAMDWTLDLFFSPDIVLLKLFMRQAGSEVPIDTAPTEIHHV